MEDNNMITFEECVHTCNTIEARPYFAYLDMPNPTSRKMKLPTLSMDKEAETSYYDPLANVIKIAYRNIIEMLQVIAIPTDTTAREAFLQKIVRPLIFHEYSHYLATSPSLYLMLGFMPADSYAGVEYVEIEYPIAKRLESLQGFRKDIRNIYEDERMESYIFPNFYMGVNFKENAFLINGYDPNNKDQIPAPENAFQFLYHHVRLEGAGCVPLSEDTKKALRGAFRYRNLMRGDYSTVENSNQAYYAAYWSDNVSSYVGDLEKSAWDIIREYYEAYEPTTLKEYGTKYGFHYKQLGDRKKTQVCQLILADQIEQESNDAPDSQDGGNAGNSGNSSPGSSSQGSSGRGSSANDNSNGSQNSEGSNGGNNDSNDSNDSQNSNKSQDSNGKKKIESGPVCKRKSTQAPIDITDILKGMEGEGNGSASGKGDATPQTLAQINQVLNALEFKLSWQEGGATYSKLIAPLEGLLRKKHQTGGSRPSHSGSRPVAANFGHYTTYRDYKWFNRPVIESDFGGGYKKLELILWIDGSGSMGSIVDPLNQIFASLDVIEEELNETSERFSYHMVRCGVSEVILSDAKRRIYASGGNDFDDQAYKIKAELEEGGRDTAIYHIAIFDGDAYSSGGYGRYDDIDNYCDNDNLGRPFEIFNNPNSIVISDPENEEYIKKYCPQARSIMIKRDYPQVLVDTLVTLLNQIMQQ